MAVGPVDFGAWSIETCLADESYHQATDFVVGRRRIRRVHVDRRTLVLGSHQHAGPELGSASDESGVDVWRRATGGGAVVVEPHGTVWLDVSIGATDPLWSDDVLVAPMWLGEAWADVIAELVAAVDGNRSAGAIDVAVHAGRASDDPWSRKACLAGIGPGEVVVGGRKIVGIAQRRTRDGATFQCVVPGRDMSEETARLVAGAGERLALEARLRNRSTSLSELGLRPGEVEEAMVAHLVGRFRPS